MGLEGLLTPQVMWLLLWVQLCRGAEEVRLEDGGGRCAGRVEVKHKGQWGTVCGVFWDKKDAAVVCKQLGCGSALQVGHFGPGSGPIWMFGVECHGTESALSDCTDRKTYQQYCHHTWDAGVTCSEYTGFRLVNGSTACEGRVEVQVLGTWGTLCDSRWHLLDAHVLCRHLDCGFAESVPGGGHFGRGTGPVWRDSFHCDGTEAQLGQCPVTALGAPPCSHENDAAVVCSDGSASLRLVGGGSRCDGRVEIFQRGTWGRVLDDQWDVQEASVVCRQLRCGEAEEGYNPSKPQRGTGPVGLRGVRCTGHEATLTLCKTSLPKSARAAGIAEDVGVICRGSRQVRLVNGPGRCAGRVEIYYQGSWGTVCDDGWDLSDATIVCRQLGCGGAVEAVGSAGFGEGSGQIWLDGVNCSGAEAALWDCPAGSWGQHDCGHKEDAGVVCSEFVALRLENSTNCSGRLQVFYNGTWGSVLSNPMPAKTVSLACEELGCGDSGYQETPPPSVRVFGSAWVDHVECGERNSSFWQCPSAAWQLQSYDDLRDETHITCAVKGRDRAHRGFSVPCQTLLLLVAQMGLQLSEPHMFTSSCQLGSQQRLGEAEVSPGEVSEETSQGSEEHPLHGHAPAALNQDPWLCLLSRCPGRSLPSPDREKIRATGGENGCSGRVEVWHRGSWGTVCDDSWDMRDAAVACRQLGCGPAVSALEEAAFGEGTGPIWLEKVECRGTESSLQDCWARPGDSGACRHKEDAAVNCSAAPSTAAPTLRADPSQGRPTSSGRVSLPVIICIVLGALLCLLLALLAGQVRSARAGRRDLERAGEPFPEAVYEEIGYSPPWEKQASFSGSDVPVLPGGDPVDGYDDAREVPEPGEDAVPGQDDWEMPRAPEEGAGLRDGGANLHSHSHAGAPGAEGEAWSLSPESTGYDDAEEAPLPHPPEDTKAVPPELSARRSLRPGPGEPVPVAQLGAGAREERSVQPGEP
ncbi:antigen WC1.1-like [Podargus strigoides]